MSDTVSVAPVSTRRTKFKRDKPTPMRLTGDDLTIIRHIGKHRFLRSTQLIQLMPDRSAKKIIERLCILYHNGYIDRPRGQLDYYSTTGSAPMVYALGNRGALVLAEHDGMDRGQVDWTWKNRTVGRLYIEHTLLTADVMVAAARAVRARQDVQLIEASQMLLGAPDTTRNADNPFKLRTRTRHNGVLVDLATIPDRVFGFDFTVERKRKYFFVEADRATMPIFRSDLNQTSYLRKLLAYVSGGGTANQFGKHFGVGNFRVLTITTSAERAMTMIKVLKHLTGGSGSQQFLFADRHSLRAAPELLALEWMTGKGDRLRLAD